MFNNKYFISNFSSCGDQIYSGRLRRKKQQFQEDEVVEIQVAVCTYSIFLSI